MKDPKERIRVNSKHDWKDKLYIIIFRSSTRPGKLFDLWLLAAIFLSIIVVLLDSVSSIHNKFGSLLYALEWVFTGLFTIEYILRITVVVRKFKYVFSKFGIIDLLSILPAYIGIFFVSFQFLMVLRSLRLLRVFKIMGMHSFLNASKYISNALRNSYRKIIIFMLFITLIVIIVGSVMYIVEEDTPGFESIPNAIYWAVVTITTVGYGDVSPVTSIGKFLSIIVMLCGYSIIAVPTGIVTSEFLRKREHETSSDSCERCGSYGHKGNARYCYQCGERIDSNKTLLPKKT